MFPCIYATHRLPSGADILVTPEYAMQSLFVDKENIFPVTQYVPDPELHAVPCTLTDEGLNRKALRILSCAAQENELYLVVDIPETSPCSPEAAAHNPFANALDTAYECPPDGRIYYNSQVVFDRNGTVIARYRKKNLYLEPFFKPGVESDETALFVTDFGVVFSLQVCFDIAYLHPGLSNVVQRGVKDVAMSTAWVDILPFFVAPSVQNGWSRALGVNLLVAGHHLPELAKLGSGIFRGFSDLDHTYVYNPESGNKLIVSEVETIAATDGVRKPRGQLKTGSTSDDAVLVKHDGTHADKQPRREHLLYYDDISSYTNAPLAPSTSGEPQTVDLCHSDQICCSLTYTSSSSLNYSLLAYSGPMLQGHGTYAMYIQVCAVVWCKTVDVTTCSHISDGLPPHDTFWVNKISGYFASEYVYPVALTRNLTLVDNSLYSATRDGNLFTFTMEQEIHNFMSGGLFARWYDRDPSSDDFFTSAYEMITSLVIRTWNLFKMVRNIIN
ncbi:pantetheinase-like isoform X2 [Scylla paramamosain]|uniref:pantetheinase-like isoform X2 n=1 Tax=Scylla paramamosain TaxID=85552 RepID=UPI0030832201